MVSRPPRRQRREAQRRRRKQLDELCENAGTERCYRYDDSLNCTRTESGAIEIQDSHSVHGATIRKHLGSNVKTFAIPRTKKASEILQHGAGPWHDRASCASTGRWSCNEHDHAFDLIDNGSPDEQDPKVCLLLMLRAVLQELWYSERESQIRTALARSGKQDLREDFKWLAGNAWERVKVVRPIADNLVLRLIREDYEEIKSRKILVEGTPTTIGTSVEVTRSGNLLTMTLLPTDAGHEVIWCWPSNIRNDVTSWLASTATNLAPRQFITNMFLRSAHNIFIQPDYYRQSVEPHEPEIMERICARHTFEGRLLLNPPPGFSILG